jgi:hypothetical protein
MIDPREDRDMRAWFVVSWLFGFPLACGLGTLSIVRASPMSGGPVRYYLENPLLLWLSALLMLNVAVATADQIHRMARRGRSGT